MGIHELSHPIGVVEQFYTDWLRKVALFPRESAEDVAERYTYVRALCQKAREAFAEERDVRKDCEKYVTELLQFTRALGLMDTQNPQLREHEGFERAYDRSMAMLRYITSTVRLHFLLLDLQAIVAER